MFVGSHEISTKKPYQILISESQHPFCKDPRSRWWGTYDISTRNLTKSPQLRCSMRSIRIPDPVCGEFMKFLLGTLPNPYM